MVTQKIVTRLSNDVLPPVRMVSGDIGREILLEIYANDESNTPIDLETYSASITIIKPDNTFVIEDFDADKVELPQQAGAVSGHGYYQIKIFTSGDHQIYTGQGPFIVDDDILNDSIIESVALVNGYVFPDDFLTDADLDDYAKKTWVTAYVTGLLQDLSLDDLKDVSIGDDLQTGDVLRWDGEKWINDAATGAEALDDLTDVDITAPASGEVLTYDGSKWENAALPTVTKTATGNPIEFTDGADAPLVKCTTAITGSQDLHGYDKPWVGGAGVNKLPNLKAGTYSGNGFTVTVDSKGIATISGTSVNADNIVIIPFDSHVTIPANTTIYIQLHNSASNPNLVATFESSGYVGFAAPSFNAVNRIYAVTTTNDKTIDQLRLFAGVSGLSYNGTFAPMLTETNTEVDYSPYSNICPITAYTEGEIVVSDGDGNVTTHTATFPTSIYQGEADFVNGTATATWGYIASYAGESLPGEWISDRDEYAPGTTPTTGAQVAYELATPTTESITPTNLPIKSLSGFNHIESSTGEMEVEYITQQYEPLMPCNHYSTAEQVVGKWVDGSDVKEQTFIYKGTGAANPFTATIDMTGKSIIEVIPHYAKYTYSGGSVGYCAGSKLLESNSSVLNVEYDDSTPPTVNVTSYLGSSTETYEIAFTIRYI